jgi:CDP-paratose synthetase
MFDNKRALLTGANGFIGRQLLTCLLNDGWDVNILSSTGLIHSPLPVGSRLKIFDFNDSDIQVATTDIRAFFNFSVAYDGTNKIADELHRTNCELPIKILSAINKNNHNSVACILGDSFYRKFPLSSTLRPEYVKSKLDLASKLNELILTNGKYIRVALLLIEQVYGVGEKLEKAYPKVIADMLDNTITRIRLTSCMQRRDFIYVSDVVYAALLLAEQHWHGLLEVGCGSGVSIELKTVFTILSNLTHTKAYLGFGDLTPHQNIPDSKADINTLLKFGWRPKIGLQDGLMALVDDVKFRKSLNKPHINTIGI